MTSDARQGTSNTGASLTTLAALLFGSGFCALTQQVAWQREFRLIFGASTSASAAVLAIFMGGLGAGSVFFGRRADRHPRPLVLYAQLEGAVAICAALTPPLLHIGRMLYIAAGGTPHLGQAGGTVVRLMVAALVVLPATFLMGGTLPAASRAAEVEGDAERGRLAYVYGLNTLGAVMGGLAATFVMLETLGTRETIWVGSLGDLLIAVVASSVARKLDSVPIPAEQTKLEKVPLPPLIASGLVGFVFFLMELVWYRMLAPLLGGTVFAFGVILAAALVGIGLGGIIYARNVAPRIRSASLAGFAILCSAEAFLMLLPYGLGDRVASLILVLKPIDLFGFSGYLGRATVLCAIVVIPAATISGIQFPWLVAMMGRGERQVGRDVGAAYAFNTAGAVVGALAGGFGLIPWLSATGCWLFAGGCLALLGLVCALISMGGSSRRSAFVALALVAACLPMSFARGPTAFWRSSPIGVGRVRMASNSTRNDLINFANEQRRSILWARDGIESHVAVQDVNGHSFIVGGKSDGNAIADADMQVMGGVLGAILRPKATRAFVVGLGTGSTAGWLGAIPNMTRVDVAELEPVILDYARDCDAVNAHPFENPKVHVYLGDAREFILTSREKYDIIASEPSNPYRAGVASLFTHDFYESVANILSDDGVFLQWVQGYEIDSQTVRDIYASMNSVFPEIETWQTDSNNMLLVGHTKPHPYDVAEIRQRIGEEPIRSAMRLTWQVTEPEGLFSHFVARPEFAKAVAATDDDISTDDQNFVEYGFARTMSGGALGFEVAQLKEAARAQGWDRPVLASVDAGWMGWGRVDINGLTMSFLGPGSPLPERVPDPSEVPRMAAYASYAKGDLTRTLEVWRDGKLPIVDLFDERLVAQALAGGADDSTEKFVFEHLRDRPVEAQAVWAMYLFNKHRPRDAAAALEKSFFAYRADPWMPTTLANSTLKLAEAIARTDKAEAVRILDSLKEPFAAGAVEEARRTTQFNIQKMLDDPSRCQEFAHSMEPDVPWSIEYLTWRSGCYGATHDPLASRAEADLQKFLSSRPNGFVLGPK